MEILRLRRPIISKANVKMEFRKYNLESILYELCQIKDNIHPIERAFAATIAIEFCEPGPYDGKIIRLDNSDLMRLVNIAKSFCLKNSEKGEKFNTSSNDIFYFIFNLIANQFSITYNSEADYK